MCNINENTIKMPCLIYYSKRVSSLRFFKALTGKYSGRFSKNGNIFEYKLLE